MQNIFAMSIIYFFPWKEKSKISTHIHTQVHAHTHPPTPHTQAHTQSSKTNIIRKLLGFAVA